MINRPAEQGWVSKNLPIGPRPLGCALEPLPWDSFLLTHPCFAGRFIQNSGSKALQKVVDAVLGFNNRNMSDLVSLDGKRMHYTIVTLVSNVMLLEPVYLDTSFVWTSHPGT